MDKIALVFIAFIVDQPLPAASGTGGIALASRVVLCTWLEGIKPKPLPKGTWLPPKAHTLCRIQKHGVTWRHARMHAFGCFAEAQGSEPSSARRLLGVCWGV